MAHNRDTYMAYLAARDLTERLITICTREECDVNADYHKERLKKQMQELVDRMEKLT